MSYSTNRPSPRVGIAEIPRGEVIARYGSYVEAQKAVDYLSDQQFEVSKVSIIGSDLKSVEQVTGRLSYPRVALQGALNGVMFGAFFGLLMSLLGGTDLASSLLLPIIMGGAFWMLLATVGYAAQRGKRDFTSTNRIVAGSYEVIAAPEVAGQARHVLGGLTGGGAPGLVPSRGARGGHRGQVGHGGQGGYQGPGGPGYHGQQGPGHPGTQGSGYPGAQGSGGPYPPANQYPQQAPPQGGYPAAPAPQGQPEYGVRRPQAPAQQDINRSAQFPDLPDGRPQYGIRTAPEPGTPHNVRGPRNTGNQAPEQASPPAGAPWSRPETPHRAQPGPGQHSDGEDRGQ